jgi:hypothetical protein
MNVVCIYYYTGLIILLIVYLSIQKGSRSTLFHNDTESANLPHLIKVNSQTPIIVQELADAIPGEGLMILLVLHCANINSKALQNFVLLVVSELGELNVEIFLAYDRDQLSPGLVGLMGHPVQVALN